MRSFLNELSQLAQMALASDDLDGVLGTASEVVRRVLEMDAGLVLERRGEALHVRAADGWQGPIDGVTIEVARLHDEAPAFKAQGLVEIAVAPIAPRGEPDFGFIAGLSRTPRQLTGDELTFLRTVATLVATALVQKGAQQQIRRAVQSREQMMSVVAHDLRNPLNAVTLGATLLGRVVTDPAALRQIDTLMRAARRMQRLINDLVDVSTIQGGRLTVKSEQHRLGDIVEEALAAARPLATERTIELAGTIEAPDEAVHGDRVRLLQVLGHLLTNAIKFTDEGGRVRLTAHAGDRGVELAVEDTGPGIADADLAHIFLPYWSAAKSQRRGSGLGLYISRGIVEAHGGRLDVQTELGRGSTFRVWLPRP